MTERSLQTKVLKYLKSIPGSYTMKLSDKWVSGYPDILFIRNGSAYFFELKSEKGSATKLQLWTIGQLQRAGAVAETVKSVEEVMNILTK